MVWGSSWFSSTDLKKVKNSDFLSLFVSVGVDFVDRILTGIGTIHELTLTIPPYANGIVVQSRSKTKPTMSQYFAKSVTAL